MDKNNKENNNVIIPWEKILKEILGGYLKKPDSKEKLDKVENETKTKVNDILKIWYREDKQRWTNCSWWYVNYINQKWENVWLFLKKSFVKWSPDLFIKEFEEIKKVFKNIIPNQKFIWEWWNTYAFCVPINIKIDILLEHNKNYLIEILKNNPKLVKQIKFFIDWFNRLKSEWKIVDLYWNENLAISDENKLFYVDSFYVYAKNETISSNSLEKIKYLEEIMKNFV